MCDGRMCQGLPQGGLCLPANEICLSALSWIRATTMGAWLALMNWQISLRSSHVGKMRAFLEIVPRCEGDGLSSILDAAGFVAIVAHERGAVGSTHSHNMTSVCPLPSFRLKHSLDSFRRVSRPPSTPITTRAGTCQSGSGSQT